MAHQRQKRRMTLGADLDYRSAKLQRVSPAAYGQYTVAWICALPEELTAAQAVLDEIHETLPRQKNDSNSYVLGSIGCHNIVITSLPINEYGTNNAVNAFTNLIRTFTSIYFGLMVGIGGGVPRDNFDIRLGDIIVGTRVIQHDLGKVIASGQIQHTAVPRTLAHMLGKALSLLQAEHQPHSSRIPRILEENFRGLPNYAHPSTADRLFSSEYPHKSQASTCEECSPSALVQRSERRTRNPYIHYGTIASGNQVMKSSMVRDTVAQAVDAICFEMEAAGLSDICPCLSIRGICDYSDSHKSKEWQKYAAATATAFAREFLEKLPPTEEVLASTPQSVRERDPWFHDEKYHSCLRDLRETDPRDDKTRIEETKGGLLEDAYRWILENDKFREWSHASQSQLLWIKGDPGKGKTMLLCGLINELEEDHSSFLSYFFCQATEERLNNATAVLRGLIYLLVYQRPSLFSYIEENYDRAGKQLFEDGNAWQALSKIFTAMLEDPILSGALLIVDALDECITDQEKLLDLIVKSSSVKWIVTSRNWPEVEQWLDRSTQKVRIHLELNQDSVSKAVEAFIEYKVEQLAQKKHYDAELKDNVKGYLADNADGTFLWVALVCQQLADSKVFRKRHTRLSLELFPKGLDPLYRRMMDYIFSSHDAQICIDILAVASVVYRPVTLTELKTLLGPQNEDEYDELPEIISGCGSFLTLQGDTIYFLHHSAKEFLLSKGSVEILPSGLAHQHEIIFKRSLQALSETLRRDICQLDHPGFDINDLSSDRLEPLDPIRYSCVYWVDHLHDSGPSSLNNHLKDGGAIDLFIRKKYLFWLESLGFLRSTAEGVKAIYKLKDLATKSKASQPATKLLEDARRFILTHRRPIEIAPLQVYASGLVFSPEGSLIRVLFKHEEPGWINVKPKMDKNWNNCLQTLEGHSSPVSWIAVSPDNQLIASSAFGQAARIWDITTGLFLHNIGNHDDAIGSMTFLPDGKSLAAVSGNTIKIWNTKTESFQQPLEGHRGWILSLSSSLDGCYLASGSYDWTIKIWSLKTRECLEILEGHSEKVWSVAFSPDNRRLVSGSADSTVKIWDMKSFSCLQTLRVGNNIARSVAFSPDGRRLASGFVGGMIKIWDVATGSSLPKLQIILDSVHAIAFSADSKRLASGGSDCKVKLLDAETGAILQTLKGDGSSVESLALTADGQHLISGSDTGTVKIWAISTDVCPITIQDHDHEVDHITISNDGLRVVSASRDSIIRTWDAETGTFIQALEGHRSELCFMTFSADNKRLASCSWDRTIKVWDITAGTCLQTLEDDCDVLSLAFSIDDRYLASGSRNTAKIWDAATGQCLSTFEHNDSVDSVALSADSRYLAISSETMIRIWDTVENSFKTLPTLSQVTASAAFSADSQYLASSSHDVKVRIWDLQQCICLHTFDVGTVLNRLSFDAWTNSRLYTELGTLDLEVPNLTPDVNAESIEITTLPGSNWSGYCISSNREWIIKDGKNVLWLPSECRPRTSAVVGSTVAIGCQTGRVLIMRFS